MRFRQVIGWGVFFFLIAIIVNALPSPRGTFYYLKGKQRLSSEDFEGAVAAFNESVKSDPHFTRGLIELGSSLYALDKYSEAEAAFKQALAIRAESCAYCGLGMSVRQQGRTHEAEAALRKAIDLDPGDTCAYNQLGRMYYDLKDYPKAIESFTQEMKLWPNAVACHFLANSNYKSGKVEESIEWYLLATMLAPNNGSVFVDLGRAYNDLGRFRDARHALERAVELRPKDYQARAFLAVIRFILGDQKGAMEQHDWIQAKNPQLAAELLKSFAELGKEKNRLDQSDTKKH